MTPQLATKLTIHEDTQLATDGAAVLTFPPRRALAGAQPATGWRRDALHRRLLGVADVVAAAVALLALATYRQDVQAALVFAGLPLVVVLFKVAGLYNRDQLRVARSTLDEVPALLQATGLYALGVTILQPLLFDGALAGTQVAALWLLTFAGIAAARTAARWLADRLALAERCLVVGGPARAARIRAKLTSGGVHAAVIATLPLEEDSLDQLADPEGMRHLVRELDVDRIIVAPTTADTDCVVDAVRIAKAAGVRVSVLPRLLEVVGAATEYEDVDGMPMLGVRPFGLSRASRLLKRTFDLVLTTLIVAALAPIVTAIALAIRLDTKGPILFRQVRVGRDGRRFRIFKFRSMVVDAERHKDGLRVLNEVGDGMFKITADPRVTRVGALLRRTSLDELPQLLNVLRGDMSLVGPRPLVVDEDDQVAGLDRSRLHLTPGMTGPWQVLGARVPMHEMVGIDYRYVSTWSLWADVKLVVRTARHVLRGGNV